MITLDTNVAQELVHPQVRALMPVPPRWVETFLGPHSTVHDCGDCLTIHTAGPLAHAATRIPDAVRLDASALRDRVASAYGQVLRAVAHLDRHPVRFWNFVPGIGDPLPADRDRYMAFNAGRHDAYAQWLGPQHIVNPRYAFATASAVGITGADLEIHCLAIEQPGTPVENPRQKPAWQYSARYGPLPPCFSRAMIAVLLGRRYLLMGGTAAVVGEDSQHADDLDAQVAETLLNIESLVRSATADANEHDLPLERLIDLRVYVTTAHHAEPVRLWLARRCPGLRALEFVVAQVCRRELLVEIEGLAEI